MQQAQNANWAQPMFLRRLVALVPAAKQQLSSRHLISLNPNGKIPSKFLTLKLRNPEVEQTLQRSARARKTPEYLKDYII
ncbi:hypothetical protein WN943_021083 [Citrus x changshan-huyou]